jgi:flagellar biosynthesis GTPase FlhF
VVEAKDIIPIIVLGGLAYLALRRRAEEIPPEEEKPSPPPPPSWPWPQPPVLSAEAERARAEAERLRAEAEALWAEAERLKAEAEMIRREAESRLEEAFKRAEEVRERAREIIERIQERIERRRREAEEFMLLAQAPPEVSPPPEEAVTPPTPSQVVTPTVEVPITFEPRIPRPPGIRLSNSTLVIEDPMYIGKFITACVTWFCTNFIPSSVPHREPLEPQALRYARETGNRVVVYVDGVYVGEIPV